MKLQARDEKLKIRSSSISPGRGELRMIVLSYTRSCVSICINSAVTGGGRSKIVKCGKERAKEVFESGSTTREELSAIKEDLILSSLCSHHSQKDNVRG